jgi:hypothetical protein
MELSDCLDILEIPRDVSAVTFAELKEAYRLLAQVWHPDRYCHNEKLHAKATAKMQEINAAWSQLENFFKSGNATSIMRGSQQEEVDDYRTDVANALSNFYAWRFSRF